MAVSSDTKTVIIVDDEINIVHLLVDILESADYHAIGCSVWTEAVEAIGRQKPDLVLLDLKMPTIDGPSMLEFIRGEGLDVPVIIVSGFVTDQVSEDLSKLGVSAFVGKPFRVAEILKEVEKALASSPSSPVPASMDALYESTDTQSDNSPSPNPIAPNNEVLDALKKLDGQPTPASRPPAAAPQPKSPENEVLADLEKHDSPRPRVTPPTSVPPIQQPPTPQAPEPTATTAAPVEQKKPAEPVTGFANDLVGSLHLVWRRLDKPTTLNAQYR